MKIRTAEQYKARFAERGHAMKPKSRMSDIGTDIQHLKTLRLIVIHPVNLGKIGHGSKPKHELRFHNIHDCFPPIKVKR